MCATRALDKFRIGRDDGTMDRSAGFDVGPYLDQSSRLQAVVDMYGPVDVPAFVALSAKTEPTQGTWGPTMAADPDGLRKAPPTSQRSS